MSEFVGLTVNPGCLFMSYPAWFYNIQILVMVITGLVLLVVPVHTTSLTGGIIALYMVLLGSVSATSVISDRSDMGWKFLIGILSFLVFMLSLYFFFHNVFSFDEMFFLIFLTGMSLLIGAVQIIRGFCRDDPVIRLIGISTGIVGIILIPCLSFSALWAPVVIGAVLIVCGIVSYILKNALVAGRERSCL
jgi:uncharacterized membrane protein HdeD (DUF308 family)